MKGFNFEKDLQHQRQAVDSTIAVFENLRITEPAELEKNYVNPVFDWKTDIQYQKNIELKKHLRKRILLT
jgi:type III restriction enzyme